MIQRSYNNRTLCPYTFSCSMFEFGALFQGQSEMSEGPCEALACPVLAEGSDHTWVYL